MGISRNFAEHSKVLLREEKTLDININCNIYINIKNNIDNY